MKLTKNPAFLIICLAILFITTVFWSALSAGVHQQNADQLADPALFESWETFSQSVFPTQHTFLLKWPLFLIVQWAGGSAIVYTVATVLLSLITVGLFAWLLSRIEKRPEVLGVLFLAMSAVLLLVPIEPKPGSLLPVGMGMIATRNIEYIIFLGCALWLIQRPIKRLITWKTVTATLLLAVLFASDQLFIGLLFGGGLPLLLASFVLKNQDLRQAMTRIVVAGCTALVLSALIFFAMQLAGILDAPGTALGPYGMSLSIKNIALGSIYALLGVLAQFGANPVSGAVIAANIPAAVGASFHFSSIVSYCINAIIAGAVGYAAFFVVKNVAKKPAKKKKKDPQQDMKFFGLFGIVASAASIGLFVATNHYYAVDARYMGLIFFAGFIALALWATSIKKVPNQRVLVASGVLLVGCLFGALGAYRAFQESQLAYAEVSRQNALIVQAIQHHPVKTLIADYWRVYPILSASPVKVKPLPLGGCLEPRDAIASKTWRNNAYNESFAYLLTTEQTGTGYPACELAKVRAAFGSPSDALVLEGSAAQPKTMLLFYDKGINYEKPGTVIRPNDPSLLRSLGELNDTECKGGRTILQTVAHQDDDILFMNPDLLRGVKEGDCVRTIYFTAGDAGGEEAYWLGREEGAKAAYAHMFGVENPEWRSRDVKLSEHHQVKVSRLWSEHIRASLIFMRLPDGNVDGSGFANDQSESLGKLNRGGIAAINSVDKTSAYTKDELLRALQQLIEHYKPDEIRTQAAHDHGARFRDHSDHVTVGTLTQQVFDTYAASNPSVSIRHYIGYPVRARPANVTGEDLVLKKALFFIYAGHDSSTCGSDAACERTSYKYYLDRQYTE